MQDSMECFDPAMQSFFAGETVPSHKSNPPPPRGAVLSLPINAKTSKRADFRYNAPPPAPNAAFPNNRQYKMDSEAARLADMAPPRLSALLPSNTVLIKRSDAE